jgi:predicted O-methyltransferase YrrM
MPEDDLPASPVRWRNCQAIARRLLASVDIPWSGLSPDELEQLVRYNDRHEPLDGCVLHALAQHTRDRGDCIIEIGSYRGSSAAIQAMGLRVAGSDSLLISVDPHLEWPFNGEKVRHALREIGEEDRLVQFPCISDRAAKYLRPGCAAMIFVDGDHGYVQVRADFRNYLDLLAPGGLLLFHDYCCGDHNGLPEPQPDVRRVVEEHVLTCDVLEPLILAHTLMVFRRQ